MALKMPPVDNVKPKLNNAAVELMANSHFSSQRIAINISRIQRL